ncbi:hypothetical protein GCK32_021486 [Trichostrongylus colubriformis]|uniref:Uncharacterized protein n=1 Tax=Trichostrongylus colubriformis TaxID=6319 RepID=A0AAN8EPP2_TRICO
MPLPLSPPEPLELHVRQFTPVDEAAGKDGVKETKRRGKDGTFSIFRLLTSFMPILHWLPKYVRFITIW